MPLTPPPGPPDYPRVRRERRPRVVRVALRIAYDGSDFRGFQRQPAQRTVEGVLLEALTAAGLSTSLGFASRTDAGVHASGQVVVVRVPEALTPPLVVQALDPHLPPSIRVEAAAPAPSTFHPRWSALAKTYEYRLARVPGMERAWLAPPHDPARLDQALEGLRAAPSLGGFTAAGAPDKEAPPINQLVRHAFPDFDLLTFVGPAFRRYAIRHMVGAAVAEASGDLPAGSCILRAAEPPPYRGLRAPGDGLTLVAVHYPPALDPFLS